MNCVEQLLAKGSLFSDAQTEAETSAGDSLLERRTTTIFEDDPERWIRNNIVGKNMLLKAQFLGRMGLGPRAMTSLSRETIQRMSKTHARNKRQIEIEEEQTVEIVNDDAELEIDRCYSNIEGDFAMNFFKKTDEEMRNRYIHKLINMKIMKTEPMKKHQTMFIFDWDDTLLCTHYLGGLGFVDIAPELLTPLDSIDDLASKLLLKACELGQTFIITNSAEGWVQYSGRLFLPKTYQVIIDKDIHVISARTEYQEIFPGDSHRWKVEAFLGIERMFDKNIITNLVCVGDSRIEIDAAHTLAQKFSQAIIKTVKLRGHPKPDELVKQQALILEKIEQIYLSARNLTIRLERKPQKNDAA